MAGLVACLLLAACSSAPTESAEGDKPGEGRKRNERSEEADGGKGGKSETGSGSETSSGEGDGDGVPADATQPPGASKGNVDEGSFGDDPTASEIDPSLARATARVEDGESDSTKQGIVPDHAELIGASVEGLGEDVRLTLRFDGQVPEESPDDKTYMVVGWGIDAGGEDSYGFSAQATVDGWQVYAGGKGKTSKFPGSFQVDGNAVIMVIPWDYLGGPREFQWQTNSSWFRQLANTTHYSFDLCPDEDPAPFPGG